MSMQDNSIRKVLVSLVAGLMMWGCQGLDIPDLNNPSLDTLRKSPTRSLVASTATGLLIGTRRDIGNQASYVLYLGIIGREAYSLDAADPRTIVELLEAPNLDPGTPSFGGNFWRNPYTNIRSAHILLDSLNTVTGMTDAEKEAVRGFAKTIQALDFLHLINTRDEAGAPIDVNREFTEVAPLATKDEVFDYIARLLNEAATHLGAGGTAFPFPLGPGFTGFDTPATFLQFNRALAARVAVYRGRHDEALTALQGSFLSRDASLELGVYHSFSGGSGDQVNGLNNPNIVAHPKLVTEADKKANGEVDDRVTRKLRKLSAERKLRGLASEWGFSLYTRNDAPVAILRNEELLLLRAEALIGLGRVAEAAEDINFIRTRSGGLAPRGDLAANNALDELLKQKRYSLLFEGGHRWIDLRRYGRLGDPGLKDVETHNVHTRFPIPTPETDARR